MQIYVGHHFVVSTEKKFQNGMRWCKCTKNAII